MRRMRCVGILLWVCRMCLLRLSLGKVAVQCRLPDVNADVLPGTTRQFVEYCPEEAWPRGVGNTLVYFPVVYWFAVFTGRDLSITDLSSVGSVCRIFNCGFPFTSEMEKKYPDLNFAHSPRKVNYDLIQYFAGDKKLKNDIVNINGYAATLFPSFLSSVANSSDCVHKLTGCSRKDYLCMEHFAFQKHFPGGFRNVSMLPESIVGLKEERVKSLVSIPLHQSSHSPNLAHSMPKMFHAGIHIRAQLKSLEKKNSNATLSDANFNLYNDTIFPRFNEHLTRYFYGDQANTTQAAASVDDPPHIFISVDDVTLKKLLLVHLLKYRSPLEPVHVVYVNNSSPIKHAKHMRSQKASIEKQYFPSDAEMIPTMFDWFGLSQAKYMLSYRTGGTGMFSTFCLSAMKKGAPHVKGVFLDSRNKWKPL